MSFHLSEWSIKRPVPTIVMFLVLGIVGFFSFLNLGIDSNPNIDIPSVMITVTQPGAGPEELETQVTKKIEDAIAGLENIDQIVSTVAESRSTTVINFILGTDSNQATNEVQNAVSQIRNQLPQDINEPIVNKLEFAGGSIITYSVSSNKKSTEELSDLVDRKIAREILNVQGVASVERLGGVDREIRVDLDPSRLQAYNITATQVNQQIANFNLNLPGGRAEIGGTEQNVRTLGSAKNIQQLQEYPISLTNGDTVPLSSLGDVRDGFGEARQSAYLNGQPTVAFSVKRASGSTLVTVEEEVQKVVKQLEKTLDEDIEVKMIFSRADAIRNSYNGTIDDLWSGCILTIITVGIFLRGLRVTVITALALPLSIIPTFLVMKALDYTLNGMTLLGLALAIGNLVDDAVCMLEDVDQHLQMGKTPLQAAMDASKELGLAVVATTATIVAVFLPVAFMGGVPGQFFQPFGVTVSVSSMFSTLVAITLTPMLSAYWLKGKVKIDKELKLNGSSSRPKRKFTPYRSLLNWSLRHRITTLLIAFAFFIGSLQLIPFIPKGLFDSGDTGLSSLTLELPPGSTLADTEEVFFQVSKSLEKNPAVASVLGTLGGSTVNQGSAFINLVPKDQRELSQQEFENSMRSVFQQIPGARIGFSSRGAGGSSKDLSIVLKSENGELLNQTALELEQQMREIPGLVEVASSSSLVKPELVIVPDPDRARDLGVSVRDIARTASLGLIGDIETNLPKFNLSDRQIPIRVQINPDQRSDINTLKNLRIPSQTGELVPLSAVAKIRLGSGPAEIQRFNRARQVKVDANLEGVSLGDALAKVNALPMMNPLPEGVSQQPDGNAKIMSDIFARFGTALGFAVFCIYGILVLLYNNFLYPLAILAALPLSIGGALMGLLIMQKELGLFALIGIVLLMGLVTKNAILLVDCTLDGQKQGKRQFEAIIDAGVSRLRPIVMTSLSTIAGMVPIALAWGADGEVRSPMAIAVIGGFSTSTLLTLVVVPVLYTYIDNLVRWLGRLFKGKKKGKIEEDYLLTK
jgi:hydrophobe/amphiphile efflux-1 (HAE1) family protein